MCVKFSVGCYWDFPFWQDGNSSKIERGRSCSGGITKEVILDRETNKKGRNFITLFIFQIPWMTQHVSRYHSRYLPWQILPDTVTQSRSGHVPSSHQYSGAAKSLFSFASAYCTYAKPASAHAASHAWFVVRMRERNNKGQSPFQHSYFFPAPCAKRPKSSIRTSKHPSRCKPNSA